jgi:hypothetical protein
MLPGASGQPNGAVRVSSYGQSTEGRMTAGPREVASEERYPSCCDRSYAKRTLAWPWLFRFIQVVVHPSWTHAAGMVRFFSSWPTRHGRKPAETVWHRAVGNRWRYRQVLTPAVNSSHVAHPHRFNLIPVDAVLNKAFTHRS